MPNEVMKLHNWCDDGVDRVIKLGDKRGLVLKEESQDMLILNMGDVVALAHEFGIKIEYSGCGDKTIGEFHTQWLYENGDNEKIKKLDTDHKFRQERY